MIEKLMMTPFCSTKSFLIFAFLIFLISVKSGDQNYSLIYLLSVKCLTSNFSTMMVSIQLFSHVPWVWIGLPGCTIRYTCLERTLVLKQDWKKITKFFSIKFCSKLGYIIIQNKLKGSIVYIQIKMIISISKIF